MKKILTIMTIIFATTIVFAGGSANTYSVGGNANWGVPNNITVYTLDSNYVTDDTLGANYCNYYGPYCLAPSPGRPAYKRIRALCPASSIGATCTVSVAYQILPGKSWSDSLKSGWTVFDSVKAIVGTDGNHVDIDTLPGAAIAFRLKGVAGTSVFAKKVKIFLMSTSTESVDTKH